MKERPGWMLIDGSSLIFRAFYGVPKTTRAPDGRLVNAVRGFSETLTRLIRGRRPLRIAIAGDADWRPQRRVDLIASYKEHRVAEPVPPELIPQLPVIEKLMAVTGVDFVNVADLEAEDIIASWVDQLTGRIEIVSGDRDLFALVRDPEVKVLYPEKGGLAEVTEDEVTRRYSIPGRKYADFAAIRGDPSDGLPGLKGVGAVGAAALIRKHGSLEALIASGTLTDSQREYLVTAQQVISPGSSTPVPIPKGCRPNYPVNQPALDFLAKSLGIEQSVNGLLSALQAIVQNPAD